MHDVGIGSFDSGTSAQELCSAAEEGSENVGGDVLCTGEGVSRAVGRWTGQRAIVHFALPVCPFCLLAGHAGSVACGCIEPTCRTC